MERIFIEDVRRANGNIKFPAGGVRDFPRPTWDGIAKAAGKPLDEITAVTADVASANLAQTRTMVEQRRVRKQIEKIAPPPRGKVARVQLKED